MGPSDMMVKQQPILMECALFARPVLITSTITVSNFTSCQVLLLLLYCIRLESPTTSLWVDPVSIILTLEVKETEAWRC